MTWPTIHLYDPRFLEYVGAPESARLLSRTPEYWLHHMGREKTLAAALQLQHDAGLIMSQCFLQGFQESPSKPAWLRETPYTTFLSPLQMLHRTDVQAQLGRVVFTPTSDTLTMRV